jgi:pimeloyl-ACP methyl ester carboxylesterase
VNSTDAVLPDWFIAATAHPRRDHCIRSAGKLHVCSWNHDDTSLPPLLLVHGFRANTHWWDAIAPSLMPYARVYAMDLSGMGRSERRSAYTCDGFADDVVAVSRWLKGFAPAQALTVIGHSFGGSRTLQACERAPELIDHAIVIDSLVRSARISPIRPEAAGMRAPYPDYISPASRFRLLPDQPAVDGIKDYIARQSTRPVEGGWTWQFDPDIGTVEDFGFEDDALRAIRCRVDIVRGELSSILSADLMARLATLLPGIRHSMTIKGGHHHLMIDQPRMLSDVLSQLLAE